MSQQNKLSSAKSITITALSIALVCVSTMMIQIPIPLGYMHLGNSCILLVSVYFGPVTGLLAGGFGSALADLLTYPQWMVPTLIIKSSMGWAIGFLAQGHGPSRDHRRSLRLLVSCVTGIVIMVVGYFLFGTVLYGSLVTGAAQIPGLTLEGVIGIAIFYVLSAALEASHIPVWLHREL